MKNECMNRSVIVDVTKFNKDNTILESKNEIIHLEQLDEVCRIIDEKVEFSKTYNPLSLDGFISSNDIISILARRGAGKTTFVKSLVYLIQNSSEDTFVKLRKDLYCVDVFEPNQIMNKEHLLIRFLAQINEIFEKDIDKRCSEQYKYLDDSRRKLYEALPVIDGVGKGNLFPEWDDNAYIAERYINLASNVKELEKRIHNYIYTGLNIIGKKAILFVLDDSDVNIERSFEILEIIRLFFTSPQIIVVLTGDASLYSMIVRRSYWKYFEMDFLKKDCDAVDKSCTRFREYQRMVYRLEAQYMQKMIKADYRIFLNNVYDKLYLNKVDDNGTKILIKLYNRRKKDNELVEIVDLYHRILADLDVNKKLVSIHDTYINHFLAQPFRNQLRLFSVYDKYNRLPNKNSEAFTKGLLKVFEVYINQLSGDSKYIMAHTPIYPAWLLKFLVENKILDIGSSFLPIMDSDSLKNVVSVLGLSCYEQIKHNPSIIFDFWIRISMTKQLSAFLGENIIYNPEVNLIKYAKLYSDNGLDSILGNMITFCNNRLMNDGNIENIIPGTIIRKGICCGSDTENELRIEVKLINLLQTASISPLQKQTFTYSLYRIFSVLGELLRINSLNNSNNEFSNFVTQFEKLSAVKLYVEPNTNSRVKKNINDCVNIDSYLKKIEEVETSRKEFLNEFYNWSIKKKSLRVAPYFIESVFSRYFDMMISYKDSIKDHELSLGEYINDSILAFLNANIVEKLTLAGRAIYSLQDNENSISNVFFKNYIQFRKLENELDSKSSFIKWLFNCPLLMCYINPFIQELIRMIDKSDNYADILHIIRKFHTQLKKENYTKMLNNINGEIEIISSKIMKFERYILYLNDIRSIEGKIKIYESYINLENITIRKKNFYQKSISELENELLNLKIELMKNGVFFNEDTLVDELNNLYKLKHKLNDEGIKMTYEIGKYTDENIATNDVYNILKENSKKNMSVYNILNEI